MSNACIGRNSLFDADNSGSATTWICSTVQKEGDKPMAFSFEERGEDLFGLTYMQQLDNFLRLFKHGKQTATLRGIKLWRIQMIVWLRFMPIHLTHTRTTAIDFVVIDKKSGVVHQGIVGMKPSEDIGFEGKCQSGK
jgi:hypothetical protein